MLKHHHSIFHPSFGDLFIDFSRIFWFLLWAVSSVTNFVPQKQKSYGRIRRAGERFSDDPFHSDTLTTAIAMAM
jgi:hypothetical protein